MLRFLGLASLLLAACNTAGERAGSGECPAGEVCSQSTPNGLHFIGTPTADQLFLDGPGPTAIGGTQEVALEYDRANTVGSPLDLPYVADDDGGAGVSVVTQSGSTVTVRGERSRSNYLRILDPQTAELFDRYELSGAAVTEVELIGVDLERVPSGMLLAWGPGDQRIGIALRGDVQESSGPERQRLVDTSLELGLASSERTSWDALRMPNATVGTHALSVTSGSLSRSLSFSVVAGVDKITAQGEDLFVAPGSSQVVCFTAENSGRYVYGLTWHYTVDGAITTQGKDTLARNCLDVRAPATATGTLPITASAGGATVQLDLAVGNAARTTAPTPVARTRTTMGDRARM